MSNSTQKKKKIICMKAEKALSQKKKRLKRSDSTA